jgi:hypothetical protein
MQYQLNIAIDAEGLEEINGEDLGVTIVKQVTTTSGSASSVAWVNFQPVGSNTITWSGEYFIFSTLSELEPGAEIAIESTSDPVQMGWTYTFEQDGLFSGAMGGPGDSFNMTNKVNGMPYNFGLAQNVTVNQMQDLVPLNAIPVPPFSSTGFTPQDVVTIFLYQLVGSGTVMGGIQGGTLTVTLTPQNPKADIGFDDDSGNFYLIDQTSRHHPKHEHHRSR